MHENVGRADLELTADDLAEINDAEAQITIQGARYSEVHQRTIDR